jgi:hypothetical protein
MAARADSLNASESLTGGGLSPIWNKGIDYKFRFVCSPGKRLILVEKGNQREIISPASLSSEFFVTIDCALFRSVEQLLREVPESISLGALANVLAHSFNLPDGILLSYRALPDILSNIVFENREVGEIRIDVEQRRTDLKWVKRDGDFRWIRPNLDWPRPSSALSRLASRSGRHSPNMDLDYITVKTFGSVISRRRFDSANMNILAPRGQVKTSGLSDYMMVSSVGRDFFLDSPIQQFFASRGDDPETNDLRWTLLDIFNQCRIEVQDRKGVLKFVDDLNQDGTWGSIIQMAGQNASLEIDEFKTSMIETSWKRFSVDLWTRG